MKSKLICMMALCASMPAFAMQPSEEMPMILHIAAFVGDTELCKKLIQQRADVNEKVGSQKRTPLHYAAGAGNANSCCQLIAAGANINIFDVGIHTPLTLAIMHNHLEFVKAVLTTPLRSEYKKMRANRCGLIAIRLAKPTLPLDIRRLIDQLIINSFAQDHMNRIKEMLTRDPDPTKLGPNEDAIHLAKALNHTEIAQLLDVNIPQTAMLLLKEIKPLIRRLLIPKPKLIEQAHNPSSEIQKPDTIELPEKPEESLDENTDTKENPWEFL
jgi:hypothetical protein